MKATAFTYLEKTASDTRVSSHSCVPAPHSPSTVGVDMDSRSPSGATTPSQSRVATLDTVAAPRALNPNAKSFQPQWSAQRPAAEETAEAEASPVFLTDSSRVPIAFFPLAAMPAPKQWPVVPPAGGDFYANLSDPGPFVAESTSWPTHTAQRMSPPLSTAAPLSPRSAACRVIVEEFANTSASKDCHMVVVLNLEPRTTNKELHDIFYPMGAREVVMLSVRHSPVPNRRAGVVFFSSKAFAEVAVEKIDSFVPKGQHQPLYVRYCYPDVAMGAKEVAAEAHHVPSPTVAAPTAPSHRVSDVSAVLSQQTSSGVHANTLSTEALPWRPLKGEALDRVHSEMWRFVSEATGNASLHVVAVHGLPHSMGDVVINPQLMFPGSEGYAMWPPTACGFNLTPLQCAGASALVWYTEEAAAHTAVALCNTQSQPGQMKQVEAVYIDTPTCTMDVPQQGMEEIDMLNAYDKIDAFFLHEHCDPKTHLLSVHNLPVETDKRMLNKFFTVHGALDVEMCPFIIRIGGKECASGVAFFDNELSARTAAEKFGNFMQLQGLNAPVLRYLAKKDPVISGGSDVPLGQQQEQQQKLCDQNRQQEGRPTHDQFVPSDPLLLDVFNELRASTVDAGELAKKMFIFITRSESCKSMACQLAAVIVGALTSMRHHAVMLSTPLANALLSLHEQLGITRKGAKDAESSVGQESADSIRNTMFVQTIARALMNLLMDTEKPGESRKVAAVLCSYLFQYSYLSKSPYEFAENVLAEFEPSIRSAFEYKRNEHASVLSTRPVALMADAKEEEQHRPWLILVECLEQMTTLWRHTNKSRAKKDTFRKKYDNRLMDLAPPGTVRGAGGASLNTSARPTPRRVIARITPGSVGSAGERSTPGLSQASPALPRVSLRSGVASHDVSVESPREGTTAVVVSRLDGTNFAPRGTKHTPVIDLSRTSQQQQQQQQQQPSLMRSSGSGLSSVYCLSELMERTVYVTKVPGSLRRAQFRRLLLHFGEINKVRLYPNDAQTTTWSSLLQGGDPSTLWRSFVEFAEPSSAKAMIEYFRNTVSNANPFDFLLDTSHKWPPESHFTPADIGSLLSTRTSPARNPIYGQVPPDAVLKCSSQHPRVVTCTRPCQFGIDRAEVTIDTSPDASTAATISSSPSVFATPNLSTYRTGAEPRPAQGPSQLACCNSEAVEDEMDLRNIVNAVMPSAGAHTEERVLSPDSGSALQRMHTGHGFEMEETPTLVFPVVEADPADGVYAEDAFGPEYKPWFANPFLKDAE